MPKPRPRHNQKSAPRQSRRSGAWHSRGYLPHRDSKSLLQFITFRLHDSVPAQILNQWKSELNWQSHLSTSDPISIALQCKVEAFEDLGHGACYLKDSRICKIVQEALEHFHLNRYVLLEWAIMPNHVHVLIETSPEHPLEDVVHSWKSFTANEANKALDRIGEFWMREYFDRFIRDEKHYTDVVRYIHSQGPCVVAQSQTKNESLERP